MDGMRPGQQRVQQRVLTILFASLLTGLLTVLASELVSWLPPYRNPALAHFYPGYLLENVNLNSFPSQSTALYATVAAGIFSLNKVVGWVLWAGVAVLVALPRLYIGGHYPSDVLAGLVIGMLGYFAARLLLEPRTAPRLQRLFDWAGWPRLFAELVVFLVIYEIAIEFDDLVWIKNVLVRTLSA